MWFARLALLLLTFAYFAAAVDVEATTPLGKILGSTLTTRLGKLIYAFRGIRYAKPPVNELRFKPPVPADTWSGIYNATVDGPSCPQPTTDPVSEDCLLLNVYTTMLPVSKHNPKRPVIIYLYPGGFFVGSSRSNVAGPQYFMDQDIVLVTLNYRIGTLGFLSMGRQAPGNNGLKDQVLAMRWVKNNIEAFGGDPNSITLFGCSSGAWSVSLHMVSSMSQGLFHKAILSSGSALGIWPLSTNQLEVAKRQARIVGCSDNSPQEILDCFKTKSAKELSDSLLQFAELGELLPLIWSPVIEEDFGQERFLTDNPIELYKKGQFAKIPVVAGVNKDEFASTAFYIVGNGTILKTLDDQFEKYAPITFNYESGTAKSREVTRNVRKFYFNDGPITKSSVDDLAKLSSDALVGFSVYGAVDLIARKNHNPVYFYELTYQGRYSYFYLPGTNETQPYGVAHADDLIYLFYVSSRYPIFNTSFPEAVMVDTLTSLWATFAKTGNPIDCTNEKFDGVEWVPYHTNRKKYLDIGKRLMLKENLFRDRFAFWEQLYPLAEY